MQREGAWGGGVLGDVRGAACLLGLCLVISLSTSYSLCVRPNGAEGVLRGLGWATGAEGGAARDEGAARRRRGV